MTLIGNKRDASRALSKNLRYIGEGRSRWVYVDDDERYVYKVEKQAGWNETEHCILEMMRKVSYLRQYALPTRLFDIGSATVLAMPYVKGKSDYYIASSLEDRLSRHGIFITDMYHKNVIESDNGSLLLVDAADESYISDEYAEWAGKHFHDIEA